MNRKDLLFALGMVVVAGLLLANLLKPSAPYAYEAPQTRVDIPVHISAAGDSAWAIIGNRVYFLSLRSRTELPSGQRSINVIDSRTFE